MTRAGSRLGIGVLVVGLLFGFIYEQVLAGYYPQSTNLTIIRDYSSPEAISTQYESQIISLFKYVTPGLWQYLRLGLTYLESPQPLAPPEAVPPTYLHPDLKGYGAYGFSVNAYLDVQRDYPIFRQYSWQDILHSQQLYDLANQAYADWLLSNLQNNLLPGAAEHEIFNVLQQAWNLGLSGFKRGRKVVRSRTKRAQEYNTYADSIIYCIYVQNPRINLRLPTLSISNLPIPSLYFAYLE